MTQSNLLQTDIFHENIIKKREGEKQLNKLEDPILAIIQVRLQNLCFFTCPT